MSEYIIELTDDELNMIIEMYGVEDCSFFGYQLTGEIVRCRDCESFRAETDHFPAVCLLWGRGAEPNGFCSWGGRRDE